MRAKTRVNNLLPPCDAPREKSALRTTRTNTPCGISDFVLFSCYLPRHERLFPGDVQKYQRFCLSNTIEMRLEVDEFRIAIEIDCKIIFELLFYV
jgi:hypothetical protein